jgi:catechol 2,3-dioxygenase-like lactoylglutathione lyase family enzyme
MSDQAPTVLTEQTSFVRAIPALAVSDVPRAVAFFADVLGFDDVLAQADYAVTFFEAT